jgi:hypothetical protein
LTWKEYTFDRVAVGSHEVYLGDTRGAFGWTIVVVAGLVVGIAALSWRAKGNPLYLLCGLDRHLSLWRSQVAAWTVAVGSMVTAYGLIRLEIPDVPDSLVTLMGLSLATGGLRYVTTKGDERKVALADPQRKPKLTDLVLTHEEDTKKDELSITKAQMIFWTVLMLLLFSIKSALDGVLWDVPWQMVALMGMSQAGYVSPKLVPAKPAGAAQVEKKAGGG